MKYKTIDGQILTSAQYINWLETRLYNAEVTLEQRLKLISTTPFGCAERIENWIERLWTAGRDN